jgi:hypothetical protein
MWMDNPQHYIDQAKAQYAKAGSVRGVFGSLEAVFQPVEAERRIEEAHGTYQDIYCDYMAKGPGEFVFTDVLPEPYTLSDVVREIQYWDWLSSMRNGAFRELHPEEYPNENMHLWDREQYLDHLLETIRPITRAEALDVLKWYLDFPRYQDMNADSDGVYLNLIGMHEAA